MNSPRNLLTLLRPHQWLKNGFVALPFLFGHKLATAGDFGTALLAVASFCMASSAVYAVNDLHDVEEDKAHPRKRFRPLAAGLISPVAARIAAAVCAALALASAVLLGWEFAGLLCAYLLLNTAYTKRLKHIPYLDVSCIAAGFGLRVLGGSAAAQVHPSLWLMVLTLLLTLFLAVAKRREEMMATTGNAGIRKSLAGWSLRRLNAAVAVLAALVALAYLTYALSPSVGAYYNSTLVPWTTPFVWGGLARYLHLVFRHGQGGSPARVLLGDRPLQICVLGWLAAFALMVYCN